jgi:multidrug efflux pump
VQDLRIGGRASAAEYQYTLTGDDTAALYAWTPRLLAGWAGNARRWST